MSTFDVEAEIMADINSGEWNPHTSPREWVLDRAVQYGRSVQDEFVDRAVRHMLDRLQDVWPPVDLPVQRERVDQGIETCQNWTCPASATTTRVLDGRVTCVCDEHAHDQGPDVLWYRIAGVSG